MTTQTLTSLDVALDCLRRGWVPIPLCWPTSDGECSCGRKDPQTGRPNPHPERDVGKAPLIAGWETANPDERTVRHWFSKRWPKANVGVVLAPSGLLAIDCDSPDAYAEAEEYGLPTAITRASNNPAFLYSRPEGCSITNTEHQGESRKIDILANTQVVVFGTHRTGRRVYLQNPQDALALAPDWAVELLNKASGNGHHAEVSLSETLPVVDVNTLNVSDRIKVLILTGKHQRYPSRSEAEFAVIEAMVAGGYDDDTIASVIVSNAIGEKAREQGLKWLAAEIGRARGKAQNRGEAGTEAKASGQPVFRLWQHDDLLAANFPEQSWVVKELVPEASLVLLGGKKKLGKSWLALQMAQAVAAGAPFLQRPTSQGTVLYLCLEDGERRLNRRLLKQNAKAGLPIYYVTGRFRALDNGGLETLERALEKFKPSLTIIDTLAAAKTGRTDENAAGDMGDLANALRDLAQEHTTAIVVVAHHGKASYGDPGHDLRGSSAVAAAADVNVGLYKGESGHTLKGEGRDLEPFELRIEFDAAQTWCWQLVGDARQVAKQEAEDEVLQALETLGEADAGTIAKELGKHRTSVLPSLKRLTLAGTIFTRNVKDGRLNRILYAKNDGIGPTPTTPPTPPTRPTPSTAWGGSADGVGRVGRVGHISDVLPTPSNGDSDLDADGWDNLLASDPNG